MLSKGHRRKQQIIDTTKEMFILNGFQSTHIGKVCEELDIARGTVYQYFRNKREILYAILESAEEKIDDILDPDDLKDIFKTNPSAKSVEKFINERISDSINVIIQEPIIIKLIFRDIIGIDEGVVERVNKFIGHLTKLIMLEIEEMIKKGLCKKIINSQTTALMLIGGIFFLIHQDNIQENDSIETIVGEFLRNIMK